MGRRWSTTLLWARVSAKRTWPTSGGRSPCTASPALSRELRSRQRSHLSREGEQGLPFEMGLEMVGERIERALDCRLVVDLRRSPERGEPGFSLPVVAEEPMHIGTDDAAVGGDSAVTPPVGEAQQRTVAIGAAGFSDMHLVARKRRAIGDACAFDASKRLL